VLNNPVPPPSRTPSSRRGWSNSRGPTRERAPSCFLLAVELVFHSATSVCCVWCRRRAQPSPSQQTETNCSAAPMGSRKGSGFRTSVGRKPFCRGPCLGLAFYAIAATRFSAAHRCVSVTCENQPNVCWTRIFDPVLSVRIVSQFESHAGKGSRRAPYENIRTEQGQSLRSLVTSPAPPPTLICLI
jgi:hypothetical protein